MTTYLLYAAMLPILYFAVPAMLQMVFSMIIMLATFRVLGAHIALLLGAVVAWSLLSFLWQLIEGGMMPIAVFAAGFVFLFVHGALKADALSQHSKTAMAAEALGIIIVAGSTIAIMDGVRWI